MELRYISETSIAAVLADGDALHGTAGPCEVSFPAEPGEPYFDAALATGLTIALYVPPSAPTFTRIPKAEVWRRLTDEEAEAVDAALQAAPLRLRRVFEAAQFLDTADADYPALRAGVEAALGATRANEVLAPTY
ncbi:hypothetical protein SAMN04515666_11910 [Bosea lupini]|uniref:Uncharacterized protein n=1 Tax=Bosea lupini TaxID=1036779 RepID=A0A1H8AF45_9HYPH|nr:hypothetical protein [Bosea lupini]SEM68554.1 hypothetical protein SAMN04515666_11910 [Bosea lupini]